LKTINPHELNVANRLRTRAVLKASAGLSAWPSMVMAVNLGKASCTAEFA